MRFSLRALLLCSLFAAPSYAVDDIPEGDPTGGPKPETPPDTTAAPEKPAKTMPPVVEMHDTTAAGVPERRDTASPPAGGGNVNPTTTVTASDATTAGPAAPGADDWHFDFHGYIRAPMRVGQGHNDHPAAGQSSSPLHAPVIPDDQYLSWQHTRHNEKDWAELFLSYGNSTARGTVALEGFNFTEAAWTDSSAQFGIAQGYVTLTPDLGYQNVRFSAKVGAFWNRYGTAGRYDAGEYDTYLFGRTHVMGETLRAEIDLGDWTLGLEHGIGVNRPDPSTFNTARFTLLDHQHLDLSYAKWATLGLHYLYSWAQEEDQAGDPNVGLPDGHLSVAGADLRFDLNKFGYLYFGYSHVGAENSLVIGPALEVIHSQGGGEFHQGVTGNYLDAPGCNALTPGQPKPTNPCSGGTGGINTLLWQYEFSVANFIVNSKDSGARFWGEGPDLRATIYGMYNSVSSADPVMDGVKKFKYGADLTYSALPWFGVALRADRVQPNNRIPEQSFSVISPRLIFRSKWVTHEEITVQYSRYLYNQRTCKVGNPASDATYITGQEFCVQPPSAPVLPDGFGATAANQNANTRGAPTTTPDVNVFKVQATMWW